MKLIDTHCHLYAEEFDEDREELVTEAKTSGIECLLLPNIDLDSMGRMHDFCDTHPGFAYPMMGLHPTSVDTNYMAVLSEIESQLSKRNYCAIGEIGLDLYWDKTFLKEQKEVFEEQLRWSIDLDLPVAIHTRDAFPEVFDSLHKIGTDRLKGVFHCFSGTPDDLAEIRNMTHFKIGIGGVITFKKSTLSETIASFPLSSILLETDAPYLAPAPYRGKRNTPVYIWETARKVAETYHISMEEVVRITRTNALESFPLLSHDKPG